MISDAMWGTYLDACLEGGTVIVQHPEHPHRRSMYVKEIGCVLWWRMGLPMLPLDVLLSTVQKPEWWWDAIAASIIDGREVRLEYNETLTV